MSDQLRYHTSSASNEWYTPPDLIACVVRVLGAIDCDPASNALPYNVPATVHYTQADDGLSQPWRGSVFLNPPYGDALPRFLAKLGTERALGRCTAAITLTPARTDTRWFQALWAADVLCFLRGRVHFLGRSADRAPFPSVLGYWGPEPDRFAAVFAAIGQILYPPHPRLMRACQPDLFAGRGAA